MSKNDPAFPHTSPSPHGWQVTGQMESHHFGLTKRERAAIDMMAALISRNGTAGGWEKYAGAAVCAADDLIAELERTCTNTEK